MGTQTDNSKVDFRLKIEDFQISTRYIRKPHGGSDGYRSFGNLKIWIFCGKKSSDGVQVLATRSTHGYRIPVKYEGQRTTLESISGSKSVIFGFWLVT